MGTRCRARRVACHFALSVNMDLQLVRELRNSIKDCSDRGLIVAAKWYITALRRTNPALKLHRALGLPSFISRYHNTNEMRLLPIQKPDFRPQHPHARAHPALRLHLPPHHTWLLDRLSHLGATNPAPSHPRVKNGKQSLSWQRKLLFLRPSRMLHPKTSAERYTCYATVEVSKGSFYPYTANFW